MRQWARRDRLAKRARLQARAWRVWGPGRGAQRGSAVAMPAVPDFVDGSFLADQTVPAQRRAA